MTKVLMNIDLLGYQVAMKEALRQIIQGNYIGGIREAERVKPPFAREKLLLPAPHIMHINLEGYEGQGDDFIGIVAYHDFGIHAMHITILDKQGRLIESGEAWPYPDNPELWEYLPTECAPLGTAVNVYVTVMDCMGGVGRKLEKKTLGDEEY